MPPLRAPLKITTRGNLFNRIILRVQIDIMGNKLFTGRLCISFSRYKCRYHRVKLIGILRVHRILRLHRTSVITIRSATLWSPRQHPLAGWSAYCGAQSTAPKVCKCVSSSDHSTPRAPFVYSNWFEDFDMSWMWCSPIWNIHGQVPWFVRKTRQHKGGKL